MPVRLPWKQIDTVLLDMDGTLLDLHFDNYFWLEYLPCRYAQAQGLSVAAAKAQLIPLFAAQQGQLNWYCLDYWTQTLALPIVEIKREIAHLIALKPGVEHFLTALKNTHKQVVLITNAHPDSLSLKLERIQLASWFDQLISAHRYGLPKEQSAFWPALREALAFDPQRTLFIDDNLDILRCAQIFGIAHVLAVRQPDSQQDARDTAEFAAVTDYAELTEGLSLCGF